LPSALNHKDLNVMSGHFKEQLKNAIESMVMADIYLVSRAFLKDLNTKLQANMEEKSRVDLKKANYVLAIKTDRAVLGNYSSSSGGVSTSSGVSSSTKQNKSKGKKSSSSAANNAASSEINVDEDLLEIVYIDKTTLIKELKSLAKDISDDLLEALIEHYLKYIKVLLFIKMRV
jgi:hypothetical protein